MPRSRTASAPWREGTAAGRSHDALPRGALRACRCAERPHVSRDERRQGFESCRSAPVRIVGQLSWSDSLAFRTCPTGSAMLDSRAVTRPLSRVDVVVAVVCLLVPSAALAAEHWTIGLTTSGAAVEAVAVAGASASLPTVLLIGGLQGRDSSVDAVTREVMAFAARPQNRRPFRLLAIPIANPDAQPLAFPPAGVAYREHIEAHVLWRWIGTHAPDLVLIAGADQGLTDALSLNVIAGVGRVTARRVDAGARILDVLTDSIVR